ncbi:MAG: methylated-DNA--[protein]-cysteine S-methyltransferase [Candidatus Rokuibacteriota bacterium]
MFLLDEMLLDEFPSPLGRIAIAARDGRLCALEFARARLSRQLAARFAGLRRRRARDPFGLSARIRRYLAGDLAALDRIPVETGGTLFQQRVWRALRRIPAGDTMTYGALARTLGRGAAARAVGAANGRNPISVVVPCHRLIGGDDSLTGYGGGLWRKRWLLRHEGAAPARSRGGPRRDRSR